MSGCFESKCIFGLFLHTQSNISTNILHVHIQIQLFMVLWIYLKGFCCRESVFNFPPSVRKQNQTFNLLKLSAGFFFFTSTSVTPSWLIFMLFIFSHWKSDCLYSKVHTLEDTPLKHKWSSCCKILCCRYCCCPENIWLVFFNIHKNSASHSHTVNKFVFSVMASTFSKIITT